MPPPSHNGAQSPLRNLPFTAEIRDSIYRFALAPLEHSPTSLITGGPDPRCLSLLLVSKQTYFEAHHIFYRDNILHFRHVDALWLFLKNLGYARRLCVTHVSFSWQGLEAKEAFRLLQRCPRLSTLTILLPCKEEESEWCNHSYGYKTLREVRGLKDVRFLGIDVHASHIKPPTDKPLLTIAQAQYFQALENKYLAEMEDLQRAMMRPRLRQHALRDSEQIDLLKPRKEGFRKSEIQVLKQAARDMRI